MTLPMNDVDPKGLLPCPFCGSSSIDPEGWSNSEGVTGPACDECGASAGTIKGVDNIAAWNRRHLSAVPDGEGELVEATLRAQTAAAYAGTAVPFEHMRAALAASRLSQAEVHAPPDVDNRPFYECHEEYGEGDDAGVGFCGVHGGKLATFGLAVNDRAMKIGVALFGLVFLVAVPAQAQSELDMEARYCAGMPRQVTYIGNTRADCLDADMAIEVEFTDNWYTAIGQALYYARVEAEKKAAWSRRDMLPSVVPAAIMVCRRAPSTCDAHLARMIDTLTYHAIAMRVWHCKPDVDMALADCDFADLFGVTE